MEGHIHPISVITNKIYDYFRPYGFEVITGPEIVTTEQNFDSLNIPLDHPARNEMDTFYLKNGMTLRAHMTSLYLDEMKTRVKDGELIRPVRLLFPGRAFRNESVDATHNYIFHQIDGLVIDEKTNLGNLIASLQGMMKELMGDNIDFRIRSSYFPFTEPSIEFDIKKPGQDWLEMLGAGMVNPDVLKYYGLDPEKYQGYAFGVGLERILNVASGVDDIRYNLNGDYRYLGQF